MTPYIRNRSCRCVRCRANGLMGAAVLITLGVLFLLDSYGIIRFHDTFPVLLLVIGGVLLIARTGSTEDHIQPVPVSGAETVRGAVVPGHRAVIVRRAAADAVHLPVPVPARPGRPPWESGSRGIRPRGGSCRWSAHRA